MLPCVLCMAPTAADVGRPDLDEVETSAVLCPLAQSKSYLAPGSLITCMPAVVWIAVVIDAVPRNHKHVDYRLEGEILRRLRDVNGCSLEEFLTIISDHVGRRHDLIEQAVSKAADMKNSGSTRWNGSWTTTGLGHGPALC